MTLTTGMLISGKMSIGMEAIETAPRTAISSARTTKVYGRRSASRTIHICVRFGRPEGGKGYDPGRATSSWTPGSDTVRRPAGSEAVLERRVVEVACLVLARLVEELAGEEVAIARIAQEVTGEVVDAVHVGLRAEVAVAVGPRRPQHATTLVVNRIAIRRPPEPVLLERQREVLDRADADTAVGADDVLTADVVHVSQERVGVREELIERPDVPAGPVVSARVVELDVDAR